MIAATLDREAQLVAGALSSDPQRSKASAATFGIASERAYGSFHELIEAESQRDENERVDFVSIATPNHTHCEIACAALARVCTSSATSRWRPTWPMRQEWFRPWNAAGAVFALTHNYSGYPMMRQAREMIAAGDLGDVIAVRASYVQGWMQGMQRGVESERGAWKSDPAKNGRAGSLGDVGTHAFHLMRFVTGLTPASLLSRMSSYSGHHQLDDYGHAIIRFSQGATGLVTWSQVSHGRLNDLSIEIDGTKAALSWQQEQPNQLVVRSLGQPTRIYERNPKAGYSTSTAVAACRLPGGHPEAFFEAFANVYRDAFADMRRSNRGEPVDSSVSIYPNVYDGIEGVRFMDRCLDSNDSNSAWRQW